MSEEGYLSDAWSLLVRGGGWPAVVLTLCVCALVPVVGWAFALGYAVEWARDIALGSDEPPRQRGIDAGRCLGEGLRTLAVTLCWCVVPAVLLALGAVAMGGPRFLRLILRAMVTRPDFLWMALLAVGPIALLLPILVASPCAVLVAASAVRSAVRRDVAAGRRVCGVTEMVGRDPGGYARVSATVTLLTLACATALVMPTREAGALLVLLVLGAGGVVAGALSTLLYCLLAFASCSLLLLVSHAMVGLWVRQFAVPGRDAGGPSDWAAPTPPVPRRRARGARARGVTAGRPGAMRVSVRGVVVAVALVAAMAPVSYLVGMLGAYLEGPSLRAALDSYAVQNDKSQYGLTYEFLYQDTDGEGRVRYHLVSTEGGNVPLVLTCEFLWLDSFDAFDYRPAGWNYVCSNSEEWIRAYEAWRSSPGYDGPIR